MNLSVWDSVQFEALIICHNQFKEYIEFLHSITEKLLEHGQQPHLQFFLDEVLAFYKPK